MSPISIIECIAVIAAAVIALAAYPRSSRVNEEGGMLTSYLLAGGTLPRKSVISLLMSSSFALNSLFYGAWLGYTIGLYALIIQLAWSFSFYFLRKHAGDIRASKSLHHFVGSHGPGTRVVAGLCSLAGFMLLIGWESEILRGSFVAILFANHTNIASIEPISTILVAAVAGGCLLYTLIGGLRGNAIADLALNLFKSACVLMFIMVLGWLAYWGQAIDWRHVILPTPQTFDTNLGLFALATNVIFNLAWQFVDASSWQSIVAGKQDTPGQASENVFWSGVWIFFFPGVVATLLGIGAHTLSGVTDSSIIGTIGIAAGQLHPALLIACTAMMVCAVMSLLDGMFLACAYALIVDIMHPKKTIQELEADPIRAGKLLLFVRLVILAIAVLAIGGVNILRVMFDVSVFNFVYIVIISQLALLGPVLIGLRSTLGDRSRAIPMWCAIVASGAIGFWLTWQGSHGWDTRWRDAAGTVTAGSSLIFAFILSRIREHLDG